MKRNPIWSRDELILALDLYLKRRDDLPGEDDAAVRSLAGLLQTMAGPSAAEYKNYRSPSAVAMKLGNFQSLDPQYRDAGKKGLPGRGRGDDAVWADFAGRENEIHEAAAAIRAAVAGGILKDNPAGEDDGDDEASEGRILARIHKSRERNKRLIAKKKEKSLAASGKLECEACGFDFEAYGDRGTGFIEVHHTKPVHALMPGDKTKLEDLALLCANCHRILHRTRPWLTIAELKLIAPATSRG